MTLLGDPCEWEWLVGSQVIETIYNQTRVLVVVLVFDQQMVLKVPVSMN